MNMKLKTLIALMVGGSFAVNAAVITPTLGTAVDPSGSEEVDHLASGSATLAAFNAQTGLGVVQDWTGATGSSDIINLADVDIRITTSFSSILTDGRDTATNLQTSSGGQNFAWSGTNGQTITIDFGTWNGTAFTADRAVQSAGLAFINFGGAYDTASDQTITYRDSGASALSTQVFVGGLTDAQSSGGTEYFSGFISGSQNISSIQIAITRSSGSSDIAIDDLAFAIPEPSTFALFGLAGVAALVGLRRRA
jgi:hypothetical protein